MSLLVTIDRQLLEELLALGTTQSLELELTLARTRTGGSAVLHLEALESARRASQTVTLVRALLAADASRALVVGGREPSLVRS